MRIARWAALALVIALVPLAFAPSDTLGGANGGTPNVFPAPAPGGLTIGPAGTSDPQALARAQPFEVESISAWDIDAQRWRIYIPGAPESVNSASRDHFETESFVWIKRRDSSLLFAPASILPVRFSDTPRDAQRLPTPPGSGITVGFAGTSDPAELVGRQPFGVQTIAAFDVTTQKWLVYIHGAPSYVNTLKPTTMRSEMVVFIRSDGDGTSDPVFAASAPPPEDDTSTSGDPVLAPAAAPSGGDSGGDTSSGGSGGDTSTGGTGGDSSTGGDTTGGDGSGSDIENPPPPANIPPIANDDAAETVENDPVTVNVVVNDEDPDGSIDGSTVTVTTAASHGSAVHMGAGAMRYTPATGFFGTDTFGYKVQDDEGASSAEATVTITVIEAASSPDNTAPEAVADAATTNEDSAVTISVLANDSDPDGDTLTLKSVNQPTKGSTTSSGGSVTYTPPANFHGSATFTYVISDGNGGSDSAVVTVTVEPVNDAPIAKNDFASASAGSSSTVSVLANDSDPDGDSLTVSAVTQPAGGSVTKSATNVTYTPNGGFTGSDTFTYTVSDGQATASATVSVFVSGTTLPPSSGAFVETWDGEPATPRPLGALAAPSNWDIAVHSRDKWTWEAPDGVAGHHTDVCGDPKHDGSGTHWVSTYEDTVYQCKNHLMTAIKAGGYGVAYLAPNALVDFSGGEAKISFDVSTMLTGERDYISVWITPWEDNLQLPLHQVAPDLSGPPRRSVHLRMHTKDAWISAEQYVFYREERYGLPLETKEGITSRLVPDLSSPLGGPSAKNRQTIEIIISKTHLKVWMPDTNLVWVDSDFVKPLDWGAGVVQFGHHSYNPFKTGTPNTWHWDNFVIDPAIPFTMIKADQRAMWKAGDSDTHIRFNSPAPQNAFLRFSAIGKVEVSFNGGAFQPAKRQLGGRHIAGTDSPAFASSYWMPVPAGTQEVDFRFSPDGEKEQVKGWLAKDFAIWALP